MNIANEWIPHACHGLTSLPKFTICSTNVFPTDMILLGKAISPDKINIWSDKCGRRFGFFQRPWLDEQCSMDKVTFGKLKENFGAYYVKFCSTAGTFVGRGVVARQYFVRLSSWFIELRATWPVINPTDNFLLDDTNSLTQAAEKQV